VPSPLSGEGEAFHMTATVTNFPLSKVAGQGSPLLSSLASLFTVHVRECPSTPSGTQDTPPSLLHVFFFSAACFLLRFFSFFPGQGSVCPGGYVDLSQGVLHAAYLLTWWFASPKQSRSWHLVVQEPSWFLHLMWSGMLCMGLGCGGVRVLPLLRAFS
jgi:hypothetical protein